MYLNGFVKRANKTLFDYKEPQAYLKSRVLDKEDIEKFCIGYVKFARVHDDKSEDYKLLHESTNNFRGLQKRIIFPLRNVLGYVNGLVVRSLEKKVYVQYFLDEAKKIGAFFGLYEALPHILRTKKVFVHEGAIDAISFAKVFPNSISSLTSFLNEQQFEQLKFFANKIILVYDKDKAGLTGIKKMSQVYGEQYIDHLFVGDNDPNSCLKSMGTEKFRRFLKHRVPFLLQE